MPKTLFQRPLVLVAHQDDEAIGCGILLQRAEKPVVEETEAVRRKLGRSLVTVRPVPAGTVLEESMFTLKSPGDGVAWMDRGAIVGRRLLRNFDADETIYYHDVI